MSSRTIARVFVVVGCVGLPFAAFGLFVFGALVVESPGLSEVGSLLLFLAVLAPGLALFAGYVQRARGRPAWLRPRGLWLGTAAYNALGAVAAAMLAGPLGLLYLALAGLALVAYRTDTTPSPVA